MGRALLALAVALAAGLVLTGPAVAATPCGERPGRPWCDRDASAATRAQRLLDAMTLDERLGLLAGELTPNVNGRLRGVPRLGVPGLLIADGPAGVARPEDGTAFEQPGQSEALALPAGIALAASFDPRAARRYGALAAAEARDRGVDVLIGPTLDLVRTPLAGRGFETLSGEDPLLGARLGAAWIRAAQGAGIIATAKHFTAYNQETNRYSRDPRQTYDARIAERPLRELYLPAFEAAVRAGVGTVMTAYNRVNGRAMDEHRALVRGVLKGEWAFPGAVISDFILGTHSTAGSLRAGLDVELPSADFFAPARLRAALAAGAITRADVDDAARRVLRTMVAFGVLERPARVNRGPRPASAPRRRAARELAERGIVLLRNRGRLLPLARRGLRRLAVVGAAAAQYEFGGGSSAVTPVTAVTPLEGIRRQVGPGVALRTAGDDPAAAAAAARGADAAVVVLADDASEFADKTGIGLADGDPRCTTPDRCGARPAARADALVRAVAAANPNTIVVLETGGPVLLPWAGRVRAIVQAWYPGQEGGDAIARVLLGAVNPAGRLPQTFPRRLADVAVRAPGQLEGVQRRVPYAEGLRVGYRRFDALGLRPRFPFGHGLSYTTFGYRGLRVRRARGGGLVASVRVRNLGRRAGDEVPQLYLRRPGDRSMRSLAAFARVRLVAGAERRVRLPVSRRSLSRWDVRRDRWRLVPGCHRVEVGASSRDVRARTTVAVADRGGCARHRDR